MRSLSTYRRTQLFKAIAAALRGTLMSARTAGSQGVQDEIDGQMLALDILCADPERGMQRLLTVGLGSYGYRVLTVSDGQGALESVARKTPAAIILETKLEDRVNGIELCHALREWSTVPILVLSYDEDKQSKLAALNAGADDYLTKPFDMEELEARLRAILRRSAMREANNPPGQIQIRDLHIDLAKRRVSLAGQVIHLSPREYDLLCILATHPDQVLTHPMLAQALRSETRKMPNHIVRVYINALRTKLHQSDHAPYIITEAGLGYRFADH
jgi:two-component system KDP operon response regulator KdpE